MKAIIVKNIELEYHDIEPTPVFSMMKREVYDGHPTNVAESFVHQQVHDPETGEILHYYVRVSDTNVFMELVEVTDRTLRRYALERSKELERKHGIALKAHAEDVRRAFYALPWYKRLFTGLV
jgi:hypothetical protein